MWPVEVIVLGGSFVLHRHDHTIREICQGRGYGKLLGGADSHRDRETDEGERVHGGCLRGYCEVEN